MNYDHNIIMAASPPGCVDDPAQVALQLQVHDDLRWARSNSELEQKYRGGIIAVLRKDVVAHASTLDELLAQIAEVGHSLEEVAIVEYPDPFAQLPQ